MPAPVTSPRSTRTTPRRIMRVLFPVASGCTRAAAGVDGILTGDPPVALLRMERHSHNVHDYPDLDLDRRAAAALDTLVGGYSNAVIEVVAAAGLHEPIAYLCISPGQEEGMDVLPLI